MTSTSQYITTVVSFGQQHDFHYDGHGWKNDGQRLPQGSHQRPAVRQKPVRIPRLSKSFDTPRYNISRPSIIVPDDSLISLRWHSSPNLALLKRIYTVSYMQYRKIVTTQNRKCQCSESVRAESVKWRRKSFLVSLERRAGCRGTPTEVKELTPLPAGYSVGRWLAARRRFRQCATVRSTTTISRRLRHTPGLVSVDVAPRITITIFFFPLGRSFALLLRHIFILKWRLFSFLGSFVRLALSLSSSVHLPSYSLPLHSSS